MSEFIYSKMKLPAADLNGESSLPSIAGVTNVQQLASSKLDEDDGLYVGYGFLPSIFPYRMQDLYNRNDTVREFECITLENEYLIAKFLPQLGGKLYSLYDKIAKKDLLFTNSIFRPCNLAVRNAWTSGGVEFNCGMVGHHPYTCSQIFTAKTALEDGTPVLRFYEFERIRACVYQMDFFLPDNSKILYARMRIVNPNRKTVPMYWWSNIAVPEDKNCRDIIPATETYNNKNRIVGKNHVPYFEDRDITYPTNNPTAIDFFWKIPPEERKFTAHLNRDGYGLIQFSTPRQQGRKLFVWGQGPGGDRWQSFLTADGEGGRYVEIQAGIAHTQYECLPMPPLTAWEWLEGYGAMNADGKAVHGEWTGAVSEVKSKLETLAPVKAFNTLLKETHKMATSPAETLLYGSGWGALENLRREKNGETKICPHLDFGTICEQQKPYVELLNSGKFPDSYCVESWMLQDEWTELIEKSEKNCYAYIQLAAIYFSTREFDRAYDACVKSLVLRDTAEGRFILSQLYRVRGETDNSVKAALQAAKLSGGDLSYCRQSASMALLGRYNNEVIKLYESSDDKVKADGRMKMYYSYALLRSGNTDGAEKVLWSDGGISVTDIREGEISITGLYLDIQKAKAERDGRTFNAEEENIPLQFDFRMSAKRKNK